MARQQFLNGGYIGKLGATVGQRWHNKRTIRTWVRTPNPNTPAQQTTKNNFAHAVRLAQEAMQINKGAPFWQRDDMGEFSWRVGTAKRRIQAGMPDSQAIPIYPDGYTPPIVGGFDVCYPLPRFFQARFGGELSRGLIGRTLRTTVVFMDSNGVELNVLRWEQTVTSSTVCLQTNLPSDFRLFAGSSFVVNSETSDDSESNPHLIMSEYSATFNLALYGTYAVADDGYCERTGLGFYFENGVWEQKQAMVIGQVTFDDTTEDIKNTQALYNFSYEYYDAPDDWLHSVTNTRVNAGFRPRRVQVSIFTDLSNPAKPPLYYSGFTVRFENVDPQFTPKPSLPQWVSGNYPDL